jgi:uncharacterized NAD(P)/FAD-binding protein YdhS
MTSDIETPLRVVVVGGGAAGTLTALNLAKLPGIGRITMLDRDGRFGRGIAYSATSPRHRLNVPAFKMGGCDDDDPRGFVDWLQANGHATGPDYSNSFVPRSAYGDFLCSRLADATACGRIETRHDQAIRIARQDAGYRIDTASGAALDAELVFLCLGNQPPTGLACITPSSRFVSNVWEPNALDPVGSDERVLVIGTGATAIDVVIDLEQRGIRQPITMISRRGLLSRPDVEPVADPDPVATWAAPTVRELLHALRAEIRRKALMGIPWQVVIDTFRLQTRVCWQGLSETERARFVRHVRSIWLAHRHRLAPDVAEFLSRLQRERRLHVIAGRIAQASTTPSGYEVGIRRRGGDATALKVDWIMNCTGPEERYDRLRDPLVMSLLAGGQARPGPLGLGLDIDPDCRLRDREGVAQRGLYLLGPATRGTFWEITAAINIRQQISAVARHLQDTMRPMH